MNFFICHGKLITDSGIIPNPGLWISGGKLAASSPSGLKKYGFGTISHEHQYVQINADSMYIAPGFIDLHIHGGNGHDLLEGTDEAVLAVASYHARGGTTSFLATFTPAPTKVLDQAFSTINSFSNRSTGGAQLLGIHLEGPFLNPKRCGAINPAYLKMVCLQELNRMMAVCKNSLKMMTVAPELPGCNAIIEMLVQEGVVVAAGHSEANYETALSSFKAGITHATHLFNASIPLHHRKPGLVGAVLECNEISAEIITDGYHLHPAIIKLILSIKGSRGLTLGTDAVSSAGMPDGEYLFNDQKVMKVNKKITLPDGSLAGSSLTMIDAVKNMVHFTGIPLHKAIRMSSLNPARLLGIEKSKGKLAPGMDADLVLLDQDLNVKITMVQGEIVYKDEYSGSKARNPATDNL